MTEKPLRGIMYIDLGSKRRTLTVTRYAYCVHGSVYVTSLHKLADTGQTISFRPRNPECEY
ncbi:hypothetical protein HanPSC8_Chr17g0785851 [Helianthus annuus]|nr:hypothetical protein HanPSC8_Chr17g0785851 [Helianthus annuus]